MLDIRREVELMIRVQNHPNIIGFRGFFCAGENEEELWPKSSRCAIMMNLCAGGDISDMVAKGTCTFTEYQAAELICRLLSALVHIHSKNIVHRDVKAENILFTADGWPILADFGLACLTSDAEQMKRRCGSAGYC